MQRAAPLHPAPSGPHPTRAPGRRAPEASAPDPRAPRAGRPAARCRWRPTGVLVGLLAGVLMGVPTAAAQELPRKDRLSILYSNQVIFDRHGEPLVSVRVTEGQSKVRLRSKGRLTLLPGGDDGARVLGPPGAEWTVTLEDSKPGTVRWWAVAERVPAGDVARAAARRTHWTEKGHTVALFESGALIGLAGETLDTRLLTIALDPRPTKAEAEAHAATLTDVLGEVLDEAIDRPTAWLVARESRSQVEVRARDLLWLSPEAGARVELPELEWGHGTPKRGRETRSYLGDVYVAVGSDGRLAAVNLLSAERLLQGVVPSEMYPAAPLEALKAQAVAARGQLLAKVGTRHRSDPYLLCAETHCQAYRGDALSNPRTDQAVQATRGALLFDAEGLVDTVYSSSCGGHTEAFDVFWGGPPRPALPGVHDHGDGADQTPVTDAGAFIAAAPKAWCSHNAGLYRWEKTLTGAFVTQAVAEHARARAAAGEKVSAPGPVHTIEPVRRGVSGRALAVAYVGPAGRYVVEGEFKNRTLLGRLRSGLWVVRRQGGAAAGEPAQWIFRGGGFGHGVGMCQHGAIGQAQASRDHETILKHYYRGSTLRRAW